MSWQHLWSYQDRHQLVTVCTHDYFIVLLHCLYRLMVMATNVVGVMKMGNIGLEQDSNPQLLHYGPPRLPNVTMLRTPTSLCGSLPERSVQTTTL